MAKKCENCSNCPLLKDADETLLKVFMFSEKNDEFNICLDEKGVMKNNKDPNILCYLRHTYKNKNINWATVKQFYEENKDAFRRVGIE